MPVRSRSSSTPSTATPAWAAATWYGNCSPGGTSGSRPGMPDRDSSLLNACSTGVVACQPEKSLSRPKSLSDNTTRPGWLARIDSTASRRSAADPGPVASMRMSAVASRSAHRLLPAGVEVSTSTDTTASRLIAVASGTGPIRGPTSTRSVTPVRSTAVTCAPRSARRRPMAVIGPDDRSRIRTPASGGS